jgi:hypothetical protein
MMMSYRELEEENKLLKGLAPFQLFLCEIGQISAADMPGRSTVFSAYYYSSYAAEQQPVGNSFKKARKITLLVHGCVGVFQLMEPGRWGEGCSCVRDNVTVVLAS